MTATEAEVRATAEIDLRRPQPSAIPAKLAYARALAESGLLPDSYRRQPANVLWAVEYGEMLGLSTMAAITGVHVIKGKPTASAGLISALVRRAGHKLRIRGNAQAATCQIIRSDDPGYTFEVTFTIDDAKTAELLDKDNWKHFAPSMLKARAITQCARDACEEALFGLHYTPEELGAEVDEDGVVITGAFEAPCDADEPGTAGAAPAAQAPADDPWYVRDAPQQDARSNGQSWTDLAIERAAALKTEAAGQELFREAAAAARDGRCTPGQAGHVQNIITARIAGRRKEAAARILKPLADDDPWRGKILEELASDEEARDALAEVQQLVGAGTLDDDRGKLLGRAIVARFPKAALAGESDGT